METENWEVTKFYERLVEGMRPTKRSDCLSGGRNEQRPCIFFSCRYHLTVETVGFTMIAKGYKFDEESFIDRLTQSKTAKELITAYPSLLKDANGLFRTDVGLFEHTCVLDVVDKEGAVTLERGGDLLGVTRERIRQIEDHKNIAVGKGSGGAMRRLRHPSRVNLLKDFIDEPHGGYSASYRSD